MDNLTEKEIADNRGRRKMAYPSIEDQLDMIWHMIDDGVIPGKEYSLWYSTIKSIKDEYSKPIDS